MTSVRKNITLRKPNTVKPKHEFKAKSLDYNTISSNCSCFVEDEAVDVVLIYLPFFRKEL